MSERPPSGSLPTSQTEKPHDPDDPAKPRPRRCLGSRRGLADGGGRGLGPDHERHDPRHRLRGRCPGSGWRGRRPRDARPASPTAAGSMPTAAMRSSACGRAPTRSRPRRPTARSATDTVSVGVAQVGEPGPERRCRRQRAVSDDATRSETSSSPAVVWSRSGRRRTRPTSRPQQIQTLPQINRNFLNFAALAPGVRVSQSETEVTISAGGQRAEAINAFIDGASLKSNVISGGIAGQDDSRGNPVPAGRDRRVPDHHPELQGRVRTVLVGDHHGRDPVGHQRVPRRDLRRLSRPGLHRAGRLLAPEQSGRAGARGPAVRRRPRRTDHPGPPALLRQL